MATNKMQLMKFLRSCITEDGDLFALPQYKKFRIDWLNCDFLIHICKFRRKMHNKFGLDIIEITNSQTSACFTK